MGCEQKFQHNLLRCPAKVVTGFTGSLFEVLETCNKIHKQRLGPSHLAQKLQKRALIAYFCILQQTAENAEHVDRWLSGK
jgi:hypothetical protein